MSSFRLNIFLFCGFICRSGDQDYGIALKLMKYLRQEREFLPWRAAFATLSDVNRMLKRTPKYGQFKVSLKRITSIYSYSLL